MDGVFDEAMGELGGGSSRRWALVLLGFMAGVVATVWCARRWNFAHRAIAEPAALKGEPAPAV